MNLSATLCIKILSLAVVAWAVLSSSWLTVQNAGWVPWVALLLLMLLEAYGTDSKPASWSQWSAGLLKLQSPGMLPYYAVLAAFLAFGPGQVRHFSQPGMPSLVSSSSLPNNLDRTRVLPTQNAPTSAPMRPTGFPANNAPPRPTTSKPAAPGQPPASATSAPPLPSKFARKPTKADSPPPPAQALPSATPPAQSLPSAQQPAQSLPSASPPVQAPAAPTSSAKPPATPAK